jgi:hypothetical protein
VESSVTRRVNKPSTMNSSRIVARIEPHLGVQLERQSILYRSRQDQSFMHDPRDMIEAAFVCNPSEELLPSHMMSAHMGSRKRDAYHAIRSKVCASNTFNHCHTAATRRQHSSSSTLEHPRALYSRHDVRSIPVSRCTKARTPICHSQRLGLTVPEIAYH